MNKFPKRNKQADEAEQHILKAFNKINEITHGDNGNVMKKYKKRTFHTIEKCVNFILTVPGFFATNCTSCQCFVHHPVKQLCINSMYITHSNLYLL
jgi:hypothetical protein